MLFASLGLTEALMKDCARHPGDQGVDRRHPGLGKEQRGGVRRVFHEDEPSASTELFPLESSPGFLRSLDRGRCARLAVINEQKTW